MGAKLQCDWDFRTIETLYFQSTDRIRAYSGDVREQSSAAENKEPRSHRRISLCSAHHTRSRDEVWTSVPSVWSRCSQWLWGHTIKNEPGLLVVGRLGVFVLARSRSTEILSSAFVAVYFLLVAVPVLAFELLWKYSFASEKCNLKDRNTLPVYRPKLANCLGVCLSSEFTNSCF